MEEAQFQKESTVKDFLEVIFRRKWIIIGIVVVATTVVVLLNMREPAVYESSAKMLVKRGEMQSVFSTYVRTLTWEEEIASQIQLVESQIVVTRAEEIIEHYFPLGFIKGNIWHSRAGLFIKKENSRSLMPKPQTGGMPYSRASTKLWSCI